MTKTKARKEFEIQVKARAEGLCEWCRYCGIIELGVDPHHIWPKSTARKPNKWDIEQLPEGLEDWPDVEPNGTFLCSACHQGAHGTDRKARRGAGPGIRISRPAFYRMLLVQYGDRIYNGRTYKEWYQLSPFAEYLR
jgi:hypothetical protein